MYFGIFPIVSLVWCIMRSLLIYCCLVSYTGISIFCYEFCDGTFVLVSSFQCAIFPFLSVLLHSPLFVCLFVGLFVGLSVSRITQKVTYGFERNIMGRSCTDRVTNSFGQDLVYALTCGQQLLPNNPCIEQKTVNRKLEHTLCIIFIDLTYIDG